MSVCLPFVCLFVCLSVCLPGQPAVHSSVRNSAHLPASRPFIRLSVIPPTCPPARHMTVLLSVWQSRLSACLVCASTRLPTSHSVCLSVRLCIRLFICLIVCLSVCASVCLSDWLYFPLSICLPSVRPFCICFVKRSILFSFRPIQQSSFRHQTQEALEIFKTKSSWRDEEPKL